MGDEVYRAAEDLLEQVSYGEQVADRRVGGSSVRPCERICAVEELIVGGFFRPAAAAGDRSGRESTRWELALPRAPKSGAFGRGEAGHRSGIRDREPSVLEARSLAAV